MRLASLTSLVMASVSVLEEPTLTTQALLRAGAVAEKLAAAAEEEEEAGAVVHAVVRVVLVIRRHQSVTSLQ